MGLFANALPLQRAGLLRFSRGGGHFCFFFLFISGGGCEGSKGRAGVCCSAIVWCEFCGFEGFVKVFL